MCETIGTQLLSRLTVIDIYTSYVYFIQNVIANFCNDLSDMLYYWISMSVFHAGIPADFCVMQFSYLIEV